MEYAEQAIEVRRDPLTGATAVTSSELATKEEMFFGKTDWAYAEELAARTREGCFFCPEKVFEATPRYPEALLPGGRLQRGAALVFPNLFPLASLHAVITYPDRHSLRLTDFTPELIEEGLAAAVEFVERAEAFYPRLHHAQAPAWYTRITRCSAVRRRPVSWSSYGNARRSSCASKASPIGVRSPTRRQGAASG